MKPNVLIPMAGLGSRFIEMGWKIPKQLINVGEKQLIDISLGCLNLQDCNLIFIVREETVYNFHIDQILKKKFGQDIKIIVLKELTDGSVRSCLFAEEYINNEAPLIIHTLDVEFSPKFDPHFINNIESDGIILTFKSNSPNYSYVELDNNNFVKRTAEKKVISPNACVGIYGFKKGSDFCKFAKEMIEKDLRTNNEFYITPLYNIFVKHNKKIEIKNVDKIHIFGTPLEYEFYKNNIAKTFGDKPIALCSDHSGYESKEKFKEILQELNLKFIDFGTSVKEDCDYYDFIELAANAINEKQCDYAFSFCRSGQGVNMCANKFKNIRSALIYDEQSLEMSIRHNCANFFAIPEKLLFSSENFKEKIKKYLNICFNNTFDGGRHQARVQRMK